MGANNQVKQTTSCNPSQPIAVLGAGSWGTALAILLVRNGQACRLWGHNAKEMQAMAADRCNKAYLPDFKFPDNLQICSDLSEALVNVKDVLVAVPSHAFREVLELLKPKFKPGMRLVWATKGLDPKSGLLLHKVVEEILNPQPLMAIISGPSFAKEVVESLPTAVTVATTNKVFAQDLIQRLHNPTFRVYTCTDMVGVQIGGVVKNVLAIATGIADGLGYGANARSALITRGLAEMLRLGAAMGAATDTLIGLAGLGDLVLTCTDNQSRNRRFGLALGAGSTITAAEQSVGQVVEGARNAAEVYHLAKSLHVEMPIVEQVYRVLHKDILPRDAVAALLMREPKAEFGTKK